MQINYLIIPCFLFTLTGIAVTNPNRLLGDHIFINCGSTAASTALTGREWLADLFPKFSSSVEIKGSSTRSTVSSRELMISVDPVPYKTARISRSQFSYTLQLNPGQKFIRLHFNPTTYHGFQRFNDFFTVEAGPFTLLANFSASITADALAVNTFVKEFCITIQENQPLKVVFSPATSPSRGYTYAFINGIEIISVPSSLSYGDVGVQVVGHKHLFYIDNMTALEMVHRQNIMTDSVSSGDDIRGQFRIWKTILKEKANEINDMTWRISVDVGFRYLIRVHFCEPGLRMAQNDHKYFSILIDHMIVSSSSDSLHERVDNDILWYKNYIVMVKGHKQEGKRDIFVSLHSKEEFLDGLGPLEGFEIFKLSNDENSLAGPSPLPPTQDLSSRTIRILRSVLGRRNVATTVVFAVICQVNIIVHMLQKNWGRNCTEEENKPSARAKQLCRHFSLGEIQSATDDFFDAFVIGKGGFGKVYKGLIDNGRETVAIKRLKSNSKQGKREFWTEVETLSELRHVNLVPLIGYCNEQQEMILVYEYMPCGTLADHLYKLARKNNAYHPLSWKQRLKICIGAGRGLDYLHTGQDHEIIHRDIKATNILLDEKFVAKISDFGLAKSECESELQSQASTNLKGTFGYIGPNYFTTHKFTTKSDTYSFGVVLLEVLCGRPAVEPWAEEDKRSLTMWARDNISKGQFDQIVAPSLREEISPDSLQTFVGIAEKCLLDEPKNRPAIAHVVIKLELALEQQENAESLAPKEITSVANAFPSNVMNINSSIPNERTIVADVLPQKEKVRFLVPTVADSMPCTYKSREEKSKSLSPNVKTSVADALPGKYRTILSVSTRLSVAFSNLQNLVSLPIKQMKRKMIEAGQKDERKSIMYKLSQPLFRRDAFWNTRKSSKNKDLVSNSISAPLSHRTSTKILRGGTVSEKRRRSNEMILNPKLRIFSTELMTTTRNFSNGPVLGAGGLGEVDKAWLKEKSTAKNGRGSDVDIEKLSPENMQELNQAWQKENSKSSVPNERTNVADVLPLKENAKSSEVPNEITDVADAMPFTDKSLHEKATSLSPNAKTSIAYALPEPILCGTTNMTFRGITVSEQTIGSNELISGVWLSSPNLRIFSFSELKAATRNFHNDAFIGVGGFGTVYKGLLKQKSSIKNGCGSVVAIKKLNPRSMQGFEEWQSEVNILGRLSHPNMVKLLGYCWEDKELLLVYEFIQKGSLEKHLLRRGSSVEPLPWDIRLRILIGAARALAFLHSLDKKVIYRDFKPSNILLDGSYNAKLTDFGLAKLCTAAVDTHVTTRVMGTYGYAAPEYIATGHLYVKSDIYSFGVVLLEMLTGLRVLDNKRPARQQNLVAWVKPYLCKRRKLKCIIDSRMEGRCPTKSATEIAQLALNCLESDPRRRPSMQEIVETLERIGSAVAKLRRPRVDSF